MTLSDDPRMWPFRFEAVDVTRLHVDPSYQRPLTRIVDSIAGDFDPFMLDALIVSERPAGLFIIDGQHRWTGSRRIGVNVLPCLIFSGLTPQQEAVIFARRQAERKALKPIERFGAELYGGKPRAVEIQRIADVRGIELAGTSGITHPPERLSAVTALERIYDAHGPATLELVLDAIVAGWPGERNRFAREVLLGVARFCEDAQPTLSQLVKALARFKSPSDLLTRSTQVRKGKGMGGGSAQYTAELIADSHAVVLRRSRARKIT